MTTPDLTLIVIGHLVSDPTVADLHIGIQIGPYGERTNRRWADDSGWEAVGPDSVPGAGHRG